MSATSSGRRHRTLTAASVFGALLCAIAVGAILAPALPLPDPDAVDLAARRLGPLSDGHILGTDALGRDLLSRSIYGARVSLVVATAATLAGLIFGGLAGVAAGLAGKRANCAMVKGVCREFG